MQMFTQLKGTPNPMGAMQQMFGGNPMFQQAMNMAQGKSPEQLQQTFMNLAQTKGMNPHMVSMMLQQLGMRM